MKELVGKVSEAIMIDEDCGCTVTEAGEQVLCDDERLGEFRQEKCNCRSSARAAIKATLEHLRDNVSAGVREAGFNAADDGKYEDGIYVAMLSQAIKELEA